ncbi:hypothetical protein SAMN05192555_11023 [Franzmannia pantelleriensis]|uniref:Uncharacterized protein n=1 Tax=Franzmannia pantelleriensis TaxID=48727 RepID=A0A1G9R2T7_9GAMM|nr:hypothetical protein SAMN05192555_11023 [Halomonas pantelleriensis]
MIDTRLYPNNHSKLLRLIHQLPDTLNDFHEGFFMEVILSIRYFSIYISRFSTHYTTPEVSCKTQMHLEILQGLFSSIEVWMNNIHITAQHRNLYASPTKGITD